MMYCYVLVSLHARFSICICSRPRADVTPRPAETRDLAAPGCRAACENRPSDMKFEFDASLKCDATSRRAASTQLWGATAARA